MVSYANSSPCLCSLFTTSFLTASPCLPAYLQTPSAVSTVTLALLSQCPGRQLFMLGSLCKGFLSMLHCECCPPCLSDCGLNVCPSTLCIDSSCQLLQFSLVEQLCCAITPFPSLCLSTVFLIPSLPIMKEQMKG